MTPPAPRNDEAYSMILQAISEVKTIVSGLDERVRQLERATVEQSVTAAQRLDAAFRKIDEHTAQLREVENDLTCRVRERQDVTNDLDKRLTSLDKRTQDTEAVIKILQWLGAAVGGLIIVLIWGILTHTVTIGTP
jgi:hypothetical protein